MDTTGAVLLLCGLIQATVAQDCVGHNTFIIRSGHEGVGRVVAEQPVASLENCLLACSDTVSRCRAINYKTVDPDSAALCQLLEARSSDQGVLRQQQESMYYAERICLPTFQNYCSNKTWSFEMISGIKIIRGSFVSKTLSKTTMEECLVECLKRNDCQSAFFNPKTSVCQLVRINRHTVRVFDDHFEREPGWNMFENNCVYPKLVERKCDFMKIKSEGMTGMYDMKRSGVSSLKDCQQICLQWEDSTCRSYTFDKRNNICFLSHSTMRTVMAVASDRRAMRKFLEVKDQNMELGDLDDCYNFELKCKHDGMLIKGDSMRLLSGDFMTKNDDKCRTAFSDTFTFETEVPYKKCGTKKSAWGTYSNLMFLKDGGTPLVTVRDKLIQVICRIFDGEDIEVSYQLNIKSNSTQHLIQRQQALVVSPSYPVVVGPKFKLAVLDSTQKPAKQVKIGETGYLEISYVDNKSARINGSSGIEVTNLFASDLNEKTQVPLYDHDGCPVNQNVSILEVEEGKVRAKIQFSGFPESTKIFYKGLVKPCIGSCQPLCKTHKDKSGEEIRVRRSPFKHSDTDAMVLSEVQYTISTDGILLQHNSSPVIEKKTFPEIDFNRPIRLPQLLKLLITEETPTDDSEADDRIQFKKKDTPSAFSVCFTQNLTCLVTVLLACLQAVLFFLCFSIVFFYFKRYRWRRRMRPQQINGNDHVQYVVDSPTDIGSGTYRNIK